MRLASPVSQVDLAYALVLFKIVVVFIWVSRAGLACRSEAASREFGEQAGPPFHI